MKKSATFSTCRKYRYALWRIWNDSLPMVTFIGLNPSIADENIDDPTVKRCISLCKHWGYGGFYMVNLFGLRSTDASQLSKAQDPIGKENDGYINYYSKLTEKSIAIWGNKGCLLKRDKDVLSLVKEIYCIYKTKKGNPIHPLYAKKVDSIQGPLTISRLPGIRQSCQT